MKFDYNFDLETEFFSFDTLICQYSVQEMIADLMAVDHSEKHFDAAVDVAYWPTHINFFFKGTMFKDSFGIKRIIHIVYNY